MTAEADQYGNELRKTKTEISELQRMIKRLQNEIQNIQAQVSDINNKGLDVVLAWRIKSKSNMFINVMDQNHNTWWNILSSETMC